MGAVKFVIKKKEKIGRNTEIPPVEIVLSLGISQKPKLWKCIVFWLANLIFDWLNFHKWFSNWYFISNSEDDESETADKLGV